MSMVKNIMDKVYKDMDLQPMHTLMEDLLREYSSKLWREVERIRESMEDDDILYLATIDELPTIDLASTTEAEDITFKVSSNSFAFCVKGSTTEAVARVRSEYPGMQFSLLQLTEKRVRAVVERNSNGIYSIYSDDDTIEFTVTGTGKTIEEAKDCFSDGYLDIVFAMNSEQKLFTNCVFEFVEG